MALNDGLTFLHPGKGVQVPPLPKKPKRIISVEQFDTIYKGLGDDLWRLLAETAIETGLRWGGTVRATAEGLRVRPPAR